MNCRPRDKSPCSIRPLDWANSCSACDEELHEIQEIQAEQQRVQKLKEQRQKIQKLRKDHQDLLLTLSQKDDKIAELQEQAARLYQFKTQLQDLQPKQDRMNFQIRRVKAERDEALQKLQDLNRLNLKETNLQLRDELERMSSNCESLTIEKEQVECSLNLLKKQCQENQLTQIQQQRSLKIKIQYAIKENDKLKNQIQWVRDQLALAHSRNDVKDRQIAELGGEVQRRSQRITDLEKVVEGKDEQILGLNCQIDKNKNQFAREISLVQIELEKRNSVINKANTYAAQLRIKLEETLSNQRFAQSSLSDARRNISELSGFVKQLELQLNNQEIKSKQLTDKLLEAKQLLKKNEQELRCLQDRRLNERKIKSNLEQLRLETKHMKQLQLERIDELVGCVDVKRRR